MLLEEEVERTIFGGFGGDRVVFGRRWRRILAGGFGCLGRGIRGRIFEGDGDVALGDQVDGGDLVALALCVGERLGEFFEFFFLVVQTKCGDGAVVGGEFERPAIGLADGLNRPSGGFEGTLSGLEEADGVGDFFVGGWLGRNLLDGREGGSVENGEILGVSPLLGWAGVDHALIVDEE